MSFFTRGLGSDSSDSESDSDQSVRSVEQKPKKSLASKFLRGDSDSESDDSESDSSEEEEEMTSDSDDDEPRNKASRFLMDADSSDEDSDEEDKIRVMSAKDKRFAEMEAAINSIQNATKSSGAASDWVTASNELDKLLRFIQRHQTSMIASPIPPAGHIPPAFLQTITELDSNVNETIKAEKSAPKKMAANKSKALNSMKQTLKKKTKEFETVVQQYLADPEAYTAAYEKANAPPKVKKVRTATAVAEGEEGEDDGFATVGRGGRQVAAITTDSVFKNLRDIFEQRGRKNTDRAETIRILSKLLDVSETTYQKIRVLLAIIAARLDYSQNLASIPHDSWVSCLKEYDQLLSILLANKDYIVQENVEEYDDMVERTPETEGGRVAVAGNLISLIENLDNEFAKTLQHTDAHERGTEYIERLREETPLYVAITKAQVLFEREQWADQTVRAIMRRLEHVYAKPDAIVDHFEAAVNQALTGLDSAITPIGVKRDASALIHLLCVYIYHSDAPLLRARAILAHIFNHAIHGRYHQARDLLLMSHLQDTIAHADVATQIMYNRAVVQLGLAAFRRGFIHECQTILSEIFQTGRQKELLAQAVHRYNVQLSPEQEHIEKRRLLPFHMHLNVELLEAAYLTSCMLVEIPLLASVDTEEQRRRVASKGFKRLLDGADKQAFMGPPENTKDHIMKASKALQAGEWEQARDLILSIKMWQLLDNVEEVKTMLTRKIQEEGLRTYLFTYSPHYASLSLAHLADTFSLSQQAVTSIISRMIYTDELAASLDQIDGVVVFHRVEQTEVQRLAQQLSEKVVVMVDGNEKTLDVKLGQVPGNDRTAARDGAGGGDQRRQERRTGGRGAYRGRGRGRTGFNSGLGNQRRVAA